MFGRAKVVCRACNYTVEGWSELAAAMADAPEVDDEDSLPDLSDAPASDFPVYAIDGWEGDQAVAGWSSVSDAITDVSLTYEDDHGALVIVRSTAPAEWDEPGVKALEALEEALGVNDEAPQSDPRAAEVWLDAREHFDRDRMAHATSRRIGLPVDDARVEFALVEVDRAWGAAARIGGAADVLISGRDCRAESLALVRAR